MKTCSKCKIEKPYTEFNKSKTTKDGYVFYCKVCRKQYDIEYAIKNADKKKQWRTDNIDSKRDYDKQYHEENDEKYKLYNKEYRQSEHGKLVYKKVRHKYRTLKILNTIVGKNFSTADIILKLKLQHDKCVYCKISIKNNYHIDHIIPVSKNGSNEPSNIQLLCKKCNLTKNAKLPHEFAKEKGMLF